MSNYAVPPQLIEDVPYRDLGEMEVFARERRKAHCGKWMPRAQAFWVLLAHDAGGL